MVWGKRKCLELLGRCTIAIGICAALFLCNNGAAAGAYAAVSYPIVYGSAEQNDISSIRLSAYGVEYEVLPGDSLWAIAETFLGSGNRYPEIVEDNAEIISDPSLIYPGMVLRTVQECYIPTGDEPHYQGINSPHGWTVGFVEEGDFWANYTLFGGGVRCIVCMEQSRQEKTVLDTEDWADCKQNIRNYVEEQYGNTINDLDFERYQSEQGENIYIYSYVYRFDLSDYGADNSLEIYVCSGLKLTEHSQAEFIGFAYEDGIRDYVRYVTAAYEERTSGGFSNMAISPEESWPAEGLFNSFSWIHGFHDEKLREALDIPPEGQSAGESLLDRMNDREILKEQIL